jgi:PAS domain S-box-containing protein
VDDVGVPPGLLERVVETASAEVAVLDDAGDIVYTNARWREFGAANGFDGDPTTVGVNYVKVCEASPDDEHASAVAAGLRDLLAGEAETYSHEYPCHSPGQRRWFTMFARTFAFGGDRYVHTEHFDITERKEAELAVREQNRRLEALAGVLSHDLRNPLNVAEGYLDLLAERSADDDAADDGASGGAGDGVDADDLVGKVESALTRIGTIVDDSLVLARETDLEDVESVELRASAESAWDTVPTAEAALVVTDDLAFEADPGVLSNLLENLFRNAVSHGGPTVTVRVGPLDGRRGFFVEDDGPGVPPDVREDVFELGFTTGDGDEHSGMGLGIVSEIADAHGWSVDLTESADGGARFEFAGVTPA